MVCDDAGDVFQSTRPVKGATHRQHLVELETEVSIHAPREGRDAAEHPGVESVHEFQSTRPVKGATAAWPRLQVAEPVSIHAPREGRDASSVQSRSNDRSFNPRAP